MKSALVLSVATALLQSTRAQFINCTEDVTIRSQEDADELSKCDLLDGRIVISSDVTGDLRINLKNMTGTLTNFDCGGPGNGCFRHNSSVRSIYSDIASLYAVDFVGGMTELTNLSLPNLDDAKEFELVSLPKLETLQADKLLEDKGAIIVTLADLPKLEILTSDGKNTLHYSGRLNVTGTGLSELDAIPVPERLPSAPGIHVTDSKPIPEVLALFRSRVGIDDARTIGVTASGDASVDVSLVGESISLQDFSLTGVKELTLDMSSNPNANYSADSINVTHNTFDTLPIAVNSGYFPNLYIAENPELKTVHWGNMSQLDCYTTTITIANNSKLELTSTYNHNDNDTSWVWPKDTTQDMTFIGDFDMAFL